MYKNLFDLYFEIEKELGDDDKKEIELMAEIIQKIGDKKEREKNPISQDVLALLLEKVKRLRTKSLEKMKTLDSHEEAKRRFFLKVLRDKLGKDLDVAIEARKRLQLEEIAKKHAQRLVDEEKKDSPF